MIKKSMYLIIGLAVVIIAILQLTDNKKTTTKRVYQYDKEKPVPVKTDTLERQQTGIPVSYAGTFQPDRETQVSSELQGKVTAVAVNPGDRVQKGQSLIQLDNSLLQWQLQSVEVQIEGLEADVNRYTVLVRADAIEGVQLEKTQLALKSARIQKSVIEEQIRKTRIVSPFSGIVTAKMTEVGAFAAPGMPLVQITDINRLKFMVFVPEHELRRFTIGESVPVRSDIYPELPLAGQVTMVGSKANPANSYPVEFAVKNTPDLKIKAGMFGKALLPDNRDETGIVIPASVISGAGTEAWVYLVRNGKAEKQRISIGDRHGDLAVITDGLKEGDILISAGFINLYEGAPVTIK